MTCPVAKSHYATHHGTSGHSIVRHFLSIVRHFLCIVRHFLCIVRHFFIDFRNLLPLLYNSYKRKLTMNDTLLTTSEVAEKLKLSARTVYDLIRSGELKSHKFGHRTVRIKQCDLDNYISGNLNASA